MSLSHPSLARAIAILLSLAAAAAGCSDDSEGPEVAVLCVGDTLVPAPPIGGASESVAVTNCRGDGTRISWQAGESSDWFAVLPASGTTPGSFRIVADRNISDAERRDTVLVSAPGAAGSPKRVVVVQGPPIPLLCAAPGTYDFPPEGGESGAFSVTNCGSEDALPWLVTWGVNWLSPSAASGTTPDSFTVQALPNTSGAPRSTSFTVHDPDAPLLAKIIQVNQAYSLFAGRRDYALASSSCLLGAGDFDRDSDVDIAAYNCDNGEITLLTNSGNGAFWVESAYGAGPSMATGLAVADLSGDGYPDLLFSRSWYSPSPYTGNLCYVENAGAVGGFEETVYATVGGEIVELMTGDLDSDGDMDIAYLAGSDLGPKPSIGVLLNRGEAAFLGPYSYELMVEPECGDLGDVDGDGDLDILLNGEGRFVIMENNGAGFFSWLGNSQQFAGARDLSLGDFDGDGDRDCAALVDRQLLVLRNLGDGSYNTAAVLSATADARMLRALDVTGDGFADMIVCDSQETKNFIVQKSGGTLIDWTRTSYGVGIGAVRFVLADFDGDGDPDAATVASRSSSVTVIKNYSR